jgi:formate hydrogenlyase subunit 3/multisubunit Na+/H+ antiporter MnhD subunit
MFPAMPLWVWIALGIIAVAVAGFVVFNLWWAKVEDRQIGRDD